MGPVDSQASAPAAASRPLDDGRGIVSVVVGPARPRVARSPAFAAPQVYAPPSWFLSALLLLPAWRPSLLFLCGLRVGASDFRVEGNVLGLASAGEFGAALPS